MKEIPVRQINASTNENRFSIRAIESLTVKDDLLHALHRHNFYFILFIKDGSGKHEIDFITHEVTNYSVFFIRPGQVHQLQLNKGTSGFILQFSPDFYTPVETPAVTVLRKVSAKSYCCLSAERFATLSVPLEAVFDEFTKKQERYKEVIKAYLAIIFIELARQSSHPNTLTSVSKRYRQERLEEFKDLLEKNIHTKKQVIEYAALLNLTPYQLNAITKETLNQTVSELINEQIILEAKRILIGTSMQVNEVADILGYDDPSYFIRFFKKKTGVTPEAFRQNFT